MGARRHRCAVTDREKLALQIRQTTEFEFGTLCDFIDKIDGLSNTQRQIIKSRIRNHGNNVIRVSTNHLDSFNITHRNTTPVDADRIASRLQQEKG